MHPRISIDSRVVEVRAETVGGHGKAKTCGSGSFLETVHFFTRCESEELRFARPRLIAKAFNLALLVLLIDFFPHRSRILALMYSYRESFPLLYLCSSAKRELSFRHQRVCMRVCIRLV